MLSEDKILTFLKLEQLALDIEDSTKLLEQFLPIVLEELNLSGYPYVFLSSLFIDDEGKIKQTFFTDKVNKQTFREVTKAENLFQNETLFQKGSEWEMKVMYGEAAVVSDVAYFINPSYPNFSQIRSLLLLPIQHARRLSGILILASAKAADTVNAEEIEFGEMITRLVNLSFRLQDTEGSLTKITKQVYEMNAKLHQLDKLKDDFVSIASHELRTPMAAIRSYAWMALHKSDVPLSDKVERYLVRVLMSTERLINLVNDMLNISRIEGGKIEINPESVDILSLAKDVVDEAYNSRGVEKNIHFSILEERLPKVLADPEKLREVMLNILGNAVKFTAEGGSIAVSFFTDGKVVEVSVKDTGPGISKEDLGKLFTKFGRLDNSYTALSTSGGTGLGLYISKSLIELMHGKIWASSEGVGKGATFTFALPIATKEILERVDQFRIRSKGEAKGLEPAAI
ncbi:MAG: HAMP domain-containing sensor histidine kinase [Patescibacteria group bacterium]